MVLALVAPAFAQGAYPTRTITLIVPFAPGGSTDVIGRIMAEGISQVLGQPVVASNISGAGGSIGTAAIVNAAPDGYTIGMGTVSTLVINPATYKHLPFDVLHDLIPIGKIAVVPNIVAINPSVPAADMATFIALARKQPGKLSYASAGVGSVSHLLGEQFNLATGTDIVHVPYRGVSPAVNDVIGGHVDLIYDNLPSALQLVRDGRLRALAISGENRNPVLPDVPTFAELHLDDMNWMAFFGLVAPKGTPDSIVRKLNAALVDALAIPAVREKLSATQAIVAGNSPEEFRREITDELARMRRTVKEAKILLD
jgi:tripartite-type tricarboxylate transporter receptor subunit TctC